jgi:hypothetical protein
MASIKLLSDAQKVFEAVKHFLLTKVPEATRCSDDELIKQMIVYVDYFTAFYSIDSNSRITCQLFE